MKEKRADRNTKEHKARYVAVIQSIRITALTQLLWSNTSMAMWHL